MAETRPRSQSDLRPGPALRAVPLEDDELIDRIRSGQTEAYDGLVRKYQDRVFNTCWRLCGHPEDARDLTQDAFLKAFERLDGFRGGSGFYTWIFRIAVNLTLTHRRRTQRRRTISLDQTSPAGAGQARALVREVADAGADPPGRGVHEAELMDRVAEALQNLDDQARAVVVLRDIEGFDYARIGEILEMPKGTVKSRLHRARAALRAAIGEDADGP
ncbi:MAG: RNA polymerase sigma factor [Phycisphaerae bacterium]